MGLFYVDSGGTTQQTSFTLNGVGLTSITLVTAGGNVSIWTSGAVYNPMIVYDWSTETTLGIRYLTDIGDTPEYPAELNYGRGVKFNGVNQYVDTTLAPSYDNDMTFLGSVPYVEGNVFGSFGINSRLHFEIYQDKFLVGIGATASHHQVTTDYTGITEIVFGVSYNATTKEVLIEILNMGISDTFTAVIDVANATNFWLGGRTGGSTVYMTGVQNNFQLHNGILTKAKMESWYNNPEKFLYKKGGILQSEVLLQSEIDNVQAFFPMCENDEYVRDMVSYSESNIPLTFNSVQRGTEIGTVTADNTSISVDITVAGEAGETRPRIIYDIPSTTGNDDLVVNFTISGTTGTMKLKRFLTASGQQTWVNITTDGNYSLKMNSAVSGDTALYVYFDGSQTGTMNITNLSVTEFFDRYPIAEYTDSCRDEAINLTSGLQTCFWERDTYGVPYDAFFDRLQGEKSGYASTGWTPDFGVVWDLAFIVYFDSTLLEWETFGVSGASELKFKHRIDGVQATIDISTGYKNITIGHGWNMYHLSNNPTTSLVTVYHNGVSKGTVATSNEVADGEFLLGKTSESYMQQPLRMFELHDNPQDALAVYNQAVTDGLLS